MSLPKHAKRVFKGKIFDVYQWRQKMFDGSYEIFEKIKRPDTVVIIASIGNKLVCLKQRQPNTGWFMSTPAGRMDVPSESPKQAALRELAEETGMIPKKLLLWKRLPSRGKVVSTVHFYIARDCKKVTPQKLDPGEKIKILYLDFEKYLKLVDSPENAYWMGSSLADIYKARLDPKYKKYLKKLFFG